MSEFRNSRGYDDDEDQDYLADDGLRLEGFDDRLDYEDTDYYGVGTSDHDDAVVNDEGEVGGEVSPAHSTPEPVVSQAQTLTSLLSFVMTTGSISMSTVPGVRGLSTPFTLKYSKVSVLLMTPSPRSLTLRPGFHR